MYNTINVTHEFDHQYQSYDNHSTIIFLKYHDDTTLSRFLSSKAYQFFYDFPCNE